VAKTDGKSVPCTGRHCFKINFVADFLLIQTAVLYQNTVICLVRDLFVQIRYYIYEQKFYF
jgi:hypothetical protein